MHVSVLKRCTICKTLWQQQKRRKRTACECKLTAHVQKLMKRRREDEENGVQPVVGEDSVSSEANKKQKSSQDKGEVTVVTRESTKAEEHGKSDVKEEKTEGVKSGTKEGNEGDSKDAKKTDRIKIKDTAGDEKTARGDQAWWDQENPNLEKRSKEEIQQWIEYKSRQFQKAARSVNKPQLTEMNGRAGWSCGSCGNFNYDSRRVCNIRTCRAPRPAGISAPEEDKPGWICPSCGNFNYDTRVVCNIRNCRRPKPGANPHGAQSMANNQNRPGWSCPRCGNFNFDARSFCNMRRCRFPRPLTMGAGALGLDAGALGLALGAAALPNGAAGNSEGILGWTCPSCGNFNFDSRMNCNRRHCRLPRPATAASWRNFDSSGGGGNAAYQQQVQQQQLAMLSMMAAAGNANGASGQLQGR